MIWLNDGAGLEGYAPAPKFVLRVTVVDAVGQVEHFDQPFEPHAARHRERAAAREAFSAKKSLPVPALRGMKLAERTSKFGRARRPSASGRPVVPCRVVTPDVMLNGSAE